MDNVHPVVRLLVARMESHPEEFQFHANSSLAVTGRWETWISQLGWHFNEAEKELIYGKAKELIFQRVHEEVMDELLNGDERRAEAERMRKAAWDQQQAHRAVLQQQQLYAGPYDQYQQLGLGVSSPILQGISTSATTAINIGGETLDAGLIKRMKQAVGL